MPMIRHAAHREIRHSARSLSTALALALATACGGGSGEITAPGGGGPGTTPAPTLGTISGRVTSASGGAGIAGAIVSTTPATAGATADAQGNFSIANVTPGTYTVTATATGYVAGSTTVSVVAGQTATANLSLAVAATSFTFTQVGLITGPSAGVASLALSPDGSTLAYGAYGQNTITLVNVPARTTIRTLSGHTAPVTALAFSPDGQRLVSHGTTTLPPATDGTVRLWTVSSGAQIASVSTGGIRNFEFTRDGTTIAGAGGGSPSPQVILWSGATLTPIRTIANVFVSAAFSPDGSRLAAVARDDFVHVMSVSTGAQIMVLTGHSGWANATAYNAAGRSSRRAARIGRSGCGTQPRARPYVRSRVTPASRILCSSVRTARSSRRSAVE
jgi:WD40 repeat protein